MCFALAENGANREQIIIISHETENVRAERTSSEYFRKSQMKFVPGSPRAPGEPRRLPYGMHWSTTTGGETYLHWTNGLVGGSMCLHEVPGGLAGALVEYTDFGAPPPPRFVFLRAIDCAPAEAPGNDRIEELRPTK